jgi:alkanesulfonate monooxygenase SsuD/methylene tetrahydromethanopterin reductase-like flavin-dependent oxidoreductase (luciferase family)
MVPPLRPGSASADAKDRRLATRGILAADIERRTELAMRFAFMHFTRDLHAVGDVAGLAEERGFDLIGVADSPALTFDPYMALTLAAGATRRARVGTAVTNPQTRHPLIIANLAASLEAPAPGRSFLGLGTGWSGVRHAGAPEARLETLGTVVRQVRGLLAGEAVEIGGATVSMLIVQTRSAAGVCRRPVGRTDGEAAARRQAHDVGLRAARPAEVRGDLRDSADAAGCRGRYAGLARG